MRKPSLGRWFPQRFYSAFYTWLLRNSEGEVYDGIQLRSCRRNRAFFVKTRDALELIQIKDPLNFSRVRQFLKMITDFGVGGGGYCGDLQAYVVDRFELERESVEDHAGAIIHEAVHGRLARCGIPYAGNEHRHEYICKQAQIRFLRRIGQYEKVQALQFTHEWWLPDARRRRKATYLEGLRDETGQMPGVTGRWFTQVAVAMATRRNVRQDRHVTKTLRAYRRGELDIEEMDSNGDGKADCWVYKKGYTTQFIEYDSTDTGRANHRAVYTNGQVSRYDWWNQQGVLEHTGYVKYYKQGTRNEIYWEGSNKKLVGIYYREGERIVGKATVDAQGIIAEVQGQARHGVGTQLPRSSYITASP